MPLFISVQLPIFVLVLEQLFLLLVFIKLVSIVVAAAGITGITAVK